MRLRLAAMAAMVLFPGLGRAAGFEIPDNGTVALSRGAAFTAIASDGSAVMYNPAGLSNQGGLQLTLDVHRFQHNVSFTRTTPAGDNDAVDIQPAENHAPAFVTPMIVASYGRSILPLDRLTLAAGVYGPPAVGRYDFNAPGANPAADAPNRYQLIKNDTFIAYPTVSLAYRLPLPVVDIALGVSGQMVLSHFKFEQDLYTQPSVGSLTPNASNASSPQQGIQYKGKPVGHTGPTSLRFEDPLWDADTVIDLQGKKTYTAILGALVHLGPVSAGVSYRPGFKLHEEGTLKVTLPDVLTGPNTNVPGSGPIDAKVSGDQAALDIQWPSQLRVGLDVVVPAVPGRLDVAADYVREGWSSVDAFVLTPRDIQITSNVTQPQTVPPVIIPKHLKDAQSFRAGLGYQLPLPALIVELRAGGYYEKSAQPEAYTTIDAANFNRVGITGGASIGLNVGDLVGPVTLDLGGLYSPPSSRQVRNSAVPLTTSDPFLAKDTVGNGDYTASVVLLSAGLRVHFGI